MINDEKVIKLLETLRSAGLKKSTCLTLALLFLMNSSSALELNNRNTQINDFINMPKIESLVYAGETKMAVIDVMLKEPTDEEKIATILERENITREQLDVIIATVMGEAAPGSYLDAYAVINTFYNRKISKKWQNEVYKATGENKGDNIYEQITLINQSEVYTSGRYKEFLGLSEGYAYEATIDFLYSLDSMHDYLCFFASYGSREDREQFVDGGNLYYSVLEPEDREINLKKVRIKR